MNGSEICKLYVDPFFQCAGIGKELMVYVIKEYHADQLWALEKNTRAILFDQKNGFHLTNQKQLEEGRSEYFVKDV